MKKERYDITGMTCSACSSRVEQSVSKLDGINVCSVNLLTNTMQVEYDDNLLSPSKIIQTVKDAGYGASLQGEKEIKEINDGQDEKKKQFLYSLIFLILLMFLSMGHMFHNMFGLYMPDFIQNIFYGYKNSVVFAFGQFILLLPILYLNRNYYIHGFKSLFKRSPNMDSLVALGSAAATIYGIVAIFIMAYGLGHNNVDLVNSYRSDLYFESAGMIVTLITLGKYFEAKSKSKTTKAIESLVNLQPSTLIVKKDQEEVVMDISEVRVDDIVVVKTGAIIPVDGVIVKGQSYIDESTITGESIPVEKTINDKVTSGTMNNSGYLEIKANKVGEDTTINQIIKLVEEASSSKAPISKLADKVAGIFVPVVIIIALITLAVWMILGYSLEFALSMAISVLVISCPCALGLATPVAIMVGTGVGAKSGILIKSGEALETLHNVDTVVLDKTGTITNGKPEVVEYKTNLDDKLFFIIIKAIEKGSEHPLSIAIMDYLKNQDVQDLKIDKYETIFGHGIKALEDKHIYLAGNLKLMMEENVENIYQEDLDRLSSEGKTVLLFAVDQKMVGYVAVLDKEKPTSQEAISLLQQLGLKVIMLSGDNNLVVNSFKKRLNLDKVVGEVLPQHKADYIKELQANNHQVLMCGDGVNDSVALATSDVGIAISSGSDIAIENGDIVLMKNDLIDVVNAIRLSKKVITNIKENLFWAFFYNAICIPLAAGLLFIPLGIKLSPMIGAATMSLSSICVVSNSLRIKNFKVLKKKERKQMTKEIKIEGMMCENCVRHVTKALSVLPGVSNVKVSLDKGNAIISSDKEILDDVISTALEEEGYKLIK